MSESNANQQENDVATATTEEQGTEESQTRTFTQEEVNDIVKRRIARFDDYDQIKSERDELAAALETTNSTFNDFKVTSAKKLVEAQAVAIASSLNFIYPDDAPLYVDAEAALDADGNVDKEKVAEQLSKLAEQRTALIRSNSKPTGADVGLGTTGTPKKKTTGQLFADALGQ